RSARFVPVPTTSEGLIRKKRGYKQPINTKEKPNCSRNTLVACCSALGTGYWTNSNDHARRTARASLRCLIHRLVRSMYRDGIAPTTWVRSLRRGDHGSLPP